MSATPPVPTSVMDSIVSLAKRRGFVYQASEIYGGIRGFWDYGPLGVLLKNNIRDWWWRCMVECPPIGPDGEIVDMVGLDSSIIQHPTTWKASGHADTFTDPMVDCRVCNSRFRADKVYFVAVHDEAASATVIKLMEKESEPEGEIRSLGYEAVLPFLFEFAAEGDSAEATYQTLGKSIQAAARTHNIGFLKKAGIDPSRFAISKYRKYCVGAVTIPDRPTGLLLTIQSAAQVIPEHHRPCPSCGSPDSLTEPRPFNLMLDTYPGPIRDERNKAYLRPETAQGIFLNFKNIVDTTRVRVPFGVAQVGKSFRNEVTPRNFIFRSREFEQMEMEFFCPPDDAMKWYEFWRNERMKWWLTLGIKPEHLKFRDHETDELSHYSKATVDIEYLYPFTAPDFGELEGIAHRGSYDLNAHSKGSVAKNGWANSFSNAKLDYFDQELQVRLKESGASPEDVKSKSRYIPNVIEPASGLTRAVLVLLCEAYAVEARSGVERFEFFKFKPQFAPIKLGIFPLVNKDGMPEVAEKLYRDLRTKFTCEYDAKQAIGRRYARMDEIGTPFCVTVDGDTLKDQTVTIRERDSQAQIRVAIDKVEAYVRERL